MSNSKYVQIWDQFGHLYLKVNVDFISFPISPTGRLVLKRQFKAKGHGTPSSHLSWGHVALLWSEGGQIWGSLPENGDFCGFHWVKPACIIFIFSEKNQKQDPIQPRMGEKKPRMGENSRELEVVKNHRFSSNIAKLASGFQFWINFTKGFAILSIFWAQFSRS